MSSEQLSRMITFRLSAEEYDRYRQLCLERGIASVSEFARNALDLLSQHPSPPGVDTRLSALEQRLDEITAQIERLRSVVTVNPVSA